MSRQYYIKAKHQGKKTTIRIIGLTMMASGLLMIFFVIFPVLSWYAYLMPVSDIDLVAPVPESERNKSFMENFLATSIATIFDKTNYNDATNWFSENGERNLLPKVSSYTLSIPKLGIAKAFVSTVDTRLSDHLVHYPGTALPPDLGTA